MFNKSNTSEQKFIIDLLSRMTIEEKIGQMNQASISFAGGISLSLEELFQMLEDGRITKEEIHEMLSKSEVVYPTEGIRNGEVGSVMVRDPQKVNELQKIAVEESRLGIPLLIGFDVIHGFLSVYPIAIAEAGAFDLDLFEATAHMAAKESRAHGVNWHFAPMIDVARDARWGRVSEGPGEDPYVSSEFARAKIRGLQETGTSDYVAACPKHYVAYGACEGGLDYNTTNVPVSLLHNIYLAPFKAAVDEGAATVMASFNDLNGVPLTVNKFALKHILKEKYGFSGFVVSDASAVKECVVHGIAKDEYEAGVQAVNAGLDMDMGTAIFNDYLKQAVEDNRVSIDTINEAVTRILSVKKWLGLFETPYVDEEAAGNYIRLPAEHIELTLDAAKKSIVLLKNNNDILPICPSAKISLVGTLAAKREEVVGAWALNWRIDDCVSILDGMQKTFENLMYYPCCGPEGDISSEDTENAIAYGDVIVAVVGETISMSGEGNSRADITLPGKQRQFLKKLIASGKPVVAVLMNGRPLALDWEHENVHAMIESWHLGIQMGNAVAAVLAGDHNPSGKLVSSFPRASGQCPVYYNHPNTGRPGKKAPFTARYIDAGFEALYPFGYGLSYTTFEFKDFQVKQELNKLIATVIIKNTGNRAGIDVVQLYIRDMTASIVRPVKELKGFSKIHLDPGEERTVQIELLKEHMGFYNNDGEYLLEDGVFQIFIGGNSRDCLSVDIDVYFENKCALS
jgi:beta-glucosidase